MGATITRGTTFTLGQQEVDVATFILVLTNATIQDVDRDNIALSQGTPATQSATALDNPQPNEMWQDDLTHALKVFQAIGLGGQGFWDTALGLGSRYTLSSLSAAVVAGDVLSPIPLGSTEVDRLSKAVGTASAKPQAYAIATEAVSPGGTGVCIREGPAKVRSTGTINAGEGVQVSSTDGVVESAGAAGSGYGPGVFAVALSAASGGYVWISLRH